MSNLNSKFDIFRGYPAGSALEYTFSVAAGVTITEGQTVALTGNNLAATAAAATVLDPLVTAEFDVFVDPAVACDFSTVTDDHLLDITHTAVHVDMLTIPDGTTIFTTAYAGAKTLEGMIGKKRLRTTSAGAFPAAHAAVNVDYVVRPAILKSEDAASTYLVVSADAITWANNAGKARITKAGVFGTVAVGDIAHVHGGAVAGNNGGFIVTAIGAAPNSIDLDTLTYAADANSGLAGFGVEVYHFDAGVDTATCVAATHSITKLASGWGTGLAVAGDYIMIVNDAVAPANVGMWIVKSTIDADTIVVENGGGYDLLNSAGGADAILIKTPIASGGRRDVTDRKRLTELVDTGAHFNGFVTVAKDDIVMPWPIDALPTHFDTTTTRWPVASIVNDTTLLADLDTLEELAPELFIAGYAANAPYKIDLHVETAVAAAASSTQAQHTDGSFFPPDQLWLVIQGTDQYDGNFTDKVACLKYHTGLFFKVASTIANTLAPGDFVYSNAGVLTKVTRAAHAIGGSGAEYSDHKQPVGMVLYTNNTAGANGYVVVAS